jgi:glycosyltransferase involved in cell wall biosynthesis
VRIAIDIRPLQNESGLRGVGRYVRSLITLLPPGGDEHLYLESRWLAPGPVPGGLAGRRVRLLRPPRAITIFDQLATPLLCARKRIALLHSTFYALPALGAPGTKRVLTVHDLIPLTVPGSVGIRNTAIFRRIYRSARGADAVIVPSARTADDLERLVGVARGRIRVIPMGVGAPFLGEGERTVLSERGDGSSTGQAFPGGRSEIPAGRARLAVIGQLRSEGKQILLYAGGFNATKNVPFLFAALAALPEPDTVLCLVGDPGPAAAGLREAASGHGVAGRVRFLGRLDDDELAAAYRAADLFVSASLYEGFGLPALEAMACGCPVAALACGTVPEVLSGAAASVQEKDAGALAAAIRRILASEPLRREMAERGLARASELTWERTARETHALYHELSASGGRDA